MILIFSIPITPRHKERPRHGKGRTYTPDTTKDWEAQFSMLATQYLRGKKIVGPICVDVLAFFPRTQKLLEKYVRTGLYKHGTGPIEHPVKPDKDNVKKIIMDSMAKWYHDSRVYTGRTTKFYCAIGQSPEVRVRIKTEEHLPKIEELIW